MPIFTYKCKDCGEVFDFLMLNKSEKPKCKKCGSKNLEKQFAAFGVRMGESSSTSSSSCPTGTCPLSNN
jgi:putative FmdB family regulatory protein